MLAQSVFTSIILLFITNLHSQVAQQQSDQRYIAVTGSAEVVVQPDEIELEIVLKEYDKLSRLSKVEEQFIEVLEENNISTSDLEFGNSNFYWYSWWRSYRHTNQREKTYKIRLDTSTDFLSLVKDLDFKGIQSLRISDTSNTELQKMRKEIKITALRAAKEKAEYLLESIGEKIGGVIAIDEMPENNHYWHNNQQLLSNVAISSTTSGMDNVPEIKLRYEVKARFEIE